MLRKLSPRLEKTRCMHSSLDLDPRRSFAALHQLSRALQPFPQAHDSAGILVGRCRGRAIHEGRAMSKQSTFHRVVLFLAQLVDDKIGWDKLPQWLGIVTLVGRHTRLGEENLFDTGVGPCSSRIR